MGPADQEVDRGADRVDLDPVGQAVPVGLDPMARRQDRNQKSLCSKSDKNGFAQRAKSKMAGWSS